MRHACEQIELVDRILRRLTCNKLLQLERCLRFVFPLWREEGGIRQCQLFQCISLFLSISELDWSQVDIEFSQPNAFTLRKEELPTLGHAMAFTMLHITVASDLYFLEDKIWLTHFE